MAGNFAPSPSRGVEIPIASTDSALGSLHAFMMTKTCLRLLFLAAGVMSISHGCGGGSIECLGTPVACGDRDLAECNGGCRPYEGCLGESVSCESLNDNRTLCIQTGDCRYVGSCEGVEGCETTAFEACATAPGCVQVRRCYGTGVTCANLDDSQCELYAQCELSEECRGSAAPCGDLDSNASCLDAPGCFPADVTPPVVD
jgi:hypothetical protein